MDKEKEISHINEPDEPNMWLLYFYVFLTILVFFAFVIGLKVFNYEMFEEEKTHLEFFMSEKNHFV